MEANGNGYDPIELKVIGYGGKPETRMLNRANINYYKKYIEKDHKTYTEDDEVKTVLKLKTAIYFNNNPKATVVECGYDELADVLDRNAKIKKLLHGLSAEQFKKVVEFAGGLK